MVSLASVEADDFNVRPFASELEHRHVERADAGDVPDMRAADVDSHPLQRFAEIEGGAESVGGGKEHLALHDIGPRRAVV